MYIAKTVKGLEEIAAKEVKGRILLPKTIECEVLPDNPRTITTIYKKEASIIFESYDDLLEKLKEIKFQIKGTCRILCRREGDHAFRSVDVAQSLGQHLREKGFTTDYKNPQMTLCVDIMENTCYAGELIADDLHRRDYRIKNHNQSINACIAAAMIMVAGLDKEDEIVDPFCRDAIIPLEVWMQGYRNVKAFDNSRNNIRNARINTKAAKTTIEPKVYEVNWLGTLYKKNELAAIMTTIHLSKRPEVNKMYAELFKIATEIVKKKVVVCTLHPETVKEMAEKQFKVEKELEVSVGDMLYKILVFSKEKKLSEKSSRQAGRKK